jgi:adenylate cyclase
MTASATMCFAVQDEIVGSIVHALGAPDGVLEISERRRSLGIQAKSQTAYDLYLRGRNQFGGLVGNFEAAERLFQGAIAADAGFAPAYSALAWLYFVRFKMLRTTSFDDIYQKAHDLALEAIRLDQNEYRAHWVLAYLDIHMGKHEQGLAQFERALSINPNDANVLVWLAEALVYAGRANEALERCQRAMRLNPKCPNFYYWVLGFSYFHLGRYEEALAALARMTSPEHAGRLLAATYAHLDRLEEARSAAEAYLKLDPGFSISGWAKTEHYTDPKELQRFVDGLRKAGLPD